MTQGLSTNNHSDNKVDSDEKVVNKEVSLSQVSLSSSSPLFAWSSDAAAFLLVPSALNPQPSTLNPQPSTLNSQPSTLNHKP